MRVRVYGGLFDFSVSLNQTNWFRVFVERLRFSFDLDKIYLADTATVKDRIV